MEKKIIKFNENFMKSYDEDSDKGYIYIKIYSDLPFLPEKNI